MSAVTAQIVRRVIEVSQGPDAPAALWHLSGLRPDDESPQVVAADTYYTLLERCVAGGDATLPFRYAEAVRPEDFGALGLALKTAATVRDALARLVRYILIVTDSLAYAWVEQEDGAALWMRGRPPGARPGIAVANEMALCAVLSLVRQIAEGEVVPASVSFRHPAPDDVAGHAAYFGCPVAFGEPADVLALTAAGAGQAVRLADEGLSAFLLAQLDAQHAQRADGSLVWQVRRAVTDVLCEGAPRKVDIAKRLALSERTLHRRLSERGLTFQQVVHDVRREVAETLLAGQRHSLSEVAFLTGFGDQSAFQRAFKGWTGQTPGGYQKAAAP